ncbi:MAG: 50S ribosomal protein L29 [Victivallales bacterium]|jgi:large subunit ribosomal protein L29|nr:50S ribosomal protein L29 [Victivallales bacterium]
MKAKEIRQKTDEEIAKQIDDNRKEIFQLRLQAQTSELKNTARIGLLRKDIARLETEKTARKAAKAAAEAK